MELLIPGLALVAFMIWASTRIKRNAAAAFEPETIDNDGFVIQKPEGFLHVLNDDSGLAFRSYSKEVGTIGKKDVRQATAEVQIFDRENLRTRKTAIAGESESVISETPYVDGGEKAIVIETIRIEKGAEFTVSYKLVTRGKRLFELRVSVLSENKDEFSGKIESILDGFRVK
ncbi:MAG TPA: hypothetical protein VK612_04425 [Pyrinomonadaceae bacterium]|nr:hypothetical protein [Pyrinomonadaceae bacterium]